MDGGGEIEEAASSTTRLASGSMVGRVAVVAAEMASFRREGRDSGAESHDRVGLTRIFGDIHVEEEVTAPLVFLGLLVVYAWELENGSFGRWSGDVFS